MRGGNRCPKTRERDFKILERRERTGGCRACTRLLALCWRSLWSWWMLSSQQTGDRSLFVSVCMVSGVPGLCIAHTIHFSSAHCPPSKHGIPPLHLSLQSVHTGSRLEVFFPTLVLFCSHTSLRTVSQQQWLTRVSAGMLFRCFHFQNLVQNISAMTYADYVHLCDPDSFVSGPCIIQFPKSYFVCLQLSVTRVWEERLNRGGDMGWGPWVMLRKLCSKMLFQRADATYRQLYSLTLNQKTFVRMFFPLYVGFKLPGWVESEKGHCCPQSVVQMFIHVTAHDLVKYLDPLQTSFVLACIEIHENIHSSGLSVLDLMFLMFCMYFKPNCTLMPQL